MSSPAIGVPVTADVIDAILCQGDAAAADEGRGDGDEQTANMEKTMMTGDVRALRAALRCTPDCLVHASIGQPLYKPPIAEQATGTFSLTSSTVSDVLKAEGDNMFSNRCPTTVDAKHDSMVIFEWKCSICTRPHEKRMLAMECAKFGVLTEPQCYNCLYIPSPTFLMMGSLDVNTFLPKVATCHTVYLDKNGGARNHALLLGTLIQMNLLTMDPSFEGCSPVVYSRTREVVRSNPNAVYLNSVDSMIYVLMHGLASASAITHRRATDDEDTVAALLVPLRPIAMDEPVQVDCLAGHMSIPFKTTRNKINDHEITAVGNLAVLLYPQQVIAIGIIVVLLDASYIPIDISDNLAREIYKLAKPIMHTPPCAHVNDAGKHTCCRMPTFSPRTGYRADGTAQYANVCEEHRENTLRCNWTLEHFEVFASVFAAHVDDVPELAQKVYENYTRTIRESIARNGAYKTSEHFHKSDVHNKIMKRVVDEGKRHCIFTVPSPLLDNTDKYRHVPGGVIDCAQRSEMALTPRSSNVLSYFTCTPNVPIPHVDCEYIASLYDEHNKILRNTALSRDERKSMLKELHERTGLEREKARIIIQLSYRSAILPTRNRKLAPKTKKPRIV